MLLASTTLLHKRSQSSNTSSTRPPPLPQKPVGVKGEGAIAFGGGYSLTDRAWQEVSEQDPDQLILMDERAATKQTTMAMTKENEGN